MRAIPTVQLLTSAEEFIAGFEGDPTQEGVPQILRGLRAELSLLAGEEQFNQIDGHGHELSACPLCGGQAEMWERIGTRVTVKAVMCSSGDPIGPLGSGCPLYMPPEEFYRATYKEAASTWNAAIVAFAAAREARA